MCQEAAGNKAIRDRNSPNLSICGRVFCHMFYFVLFDGMGDYAASGIGESHRLLDTT